MKKLGLLALLTLSGCGYESQHNVAVGQVKGVIRRTPIFCPDYVGTNLSLGSISKEDISLYVQSDDQIRALRQAIDLGELVKVTYSTRRFTICVPHQQIDRIDIVH